VSSEHSESYVCINLLCIL